MFTDPVSGTPMDFAKRKAGVKYACVFEVRGEGFIVPPSQIEPSFRHLNFAFKFKMVHGMVLTVVFLNLWS